MESSGVMSVVWFCVFRSDIFFLCIFCGFLGFFFGVRNKILVLWVSRLGVREFILLC